MTAATETVGHDWDDTDEAETKIQQRRQQICASHRKYDALASSEEHWQQSKVNDGA